MAYRFAPTHAPPELTATMTDPSSTFIRSELPRYGRLPRGLVRDPQMPDRAVRLFGLLDDYADSDGRAFPSRAKLAEEMGCSTDSVDRAVKALQDGGWLHREVRRRADRTYASTLYTLTLGGGRTRAATGRTVAEGVAAPVPTEGTPEKEHQNNPPTPQGGSETLPLDVDHVNGQTCETGSVETTKASRTAVTDSDPDWSRFWSLYPRKTGKGGARKAWERAIRKGVPAEQILAAVARFAGTVRELRYCPHPATWLNQERWTDEDTAAVGYQHGDGPARVMTADEWSQEGRR